MTTATDLANYALAFIGEPKVSNIDDTGSKAARICKQFLDAATDEVLRAHRWNCAIKRATLTPLVATPNHGYDRAFALPSDFLRLLELNGEPAGDSAEFFEIEQGKRLLTHELEARIRYVARITVPEFDPLLAKAIALNLAGTIAVPLTAKIELQSQCAALFQRTVNAARQVDAIETGSRENRPLDRLLSKSRLIRSRYGHGRHSEHTRFH